MALEGLKRLADDNPARYNDWGVCEILYANILAVYTKVYKSSVMVGMINEDRRKTGKV